MKRGICPLAATYCVLHLLATIFYVRQHAYTAKRILATVILSVRPPVCLSRPDTDSSPGQIETPGFRRIIA